MRRATPGLRHAVDHAPAARVQRAVVRNPTDGDRPGGSAAGHGHGAANVRPMGRNSTRRTTATRRPASRAPSHLRSLDSAMRPVAWSSPSATQSMEYLVRKPGYQDLAIKPEVETRELSVTLVPETDPIKLAEAKPASVWLGALDLGDRDTKLHFQTQCTFCHQQGNAFIRMERTPEAWSDIITRMQRYGARLSSQDQRALPERLSAGYRKLRENPQLLADPLPWSPALTGITITEWPLGDIFSQVHDMLVAANGLVYVADNIQDRLVRSRPEDEPGHRLQDPAPRGRAERRLAGGAAEEFSQARQHFERAFARRVTSRRAHLHHALGAAPPGRVRPRDQGLHAARDGRRFLSAHDSRGPEGSRVVYRRAVEPGRDVRPHDEALHDVRPADPRLPRVAQRANHRGDLQADELGRAARQLVAGRPRRPPAPLCPMASTLRPTAPCGSRACTPTRSVRSIPARQDHHDRHTLQGSAAAAHRRSGQTLDHGFPRVGDRAFRSRDESVHAL